MLCDSLCGDKPKDQLATMQRSNSQPSVESDGRTLPTVDELSLVGYLEEPDASQLFEKTGMPLY